MYGGMRVQTFAALCVVVSILFIMAVASEVFINGVLHPASAFGYLLLSTTISGVLTSVILAKIDERVAN
jgi:hypothetical protein